MKAKQLILPIIIFLAIVLVALAVRLWPRTIPFDQCSDVYKRYAAVDGVVATFIKDYKVNDTVFVDVTLLEATDSVGWAILKKDFEVPPPPPIAKQLIDNGEDLIGVKLIPKSTTTDTLLNSYLNNVLAISHLNRTLTVFHTKNEDEAHTVVHYNFDKSTNPK
ncbi:MAG: hypothetical protein J6Y98_08065 [Bacteroidales bacterium]|nr:hypothetical protein [Bacteroidales bacterium]